MQMAGCEVLCFKQPSRQSSIRSEGSFRPRQSGAWRSHHLAYEAMQLLRAFFIIRDCAKDALGGDWSTEMESAWQDLLAQVRLQKRPRPLILDTQKVAAANKRE